MPQRTTETVGFVHMADGTREDYDTLPLEHFEPMVRRVFAKPRRAFD